MSILAWANIYLGFFAVFLQCAHMAPDASEIGGEE
jgi:hypothetical protein